MTNQNQTSKTGSIERRTFLKTAAAAGAGPIIAREATAKPTPHGKAHYTEVGIEYEIENTIAHEKYPFIAVDEPINHYADLEGSAVYFNEKYLEESLPVLRSGPSLVRFNQFADQSVSRSTSPTRSLPTNLGRSFRITSSLRLAEPYRPERVSVAVENGVAVVRSEHDEVEVPPSTAITNELGTQEVTVEASEPIPREYESIDVLIDGEPAPPEYRPVARRTWEETLTVKPKVKVRNYGEVDLIGIDTRFPEVIPADASNN